METLCEIWEQRSNVCFTFEIPPKPAYLSHPSSSVFMKLNVNARFAETFPLAKRCFASFSMFRIENSGERIKGKGAGGGHVRGAPSRAVGGCGKQAIQPSIRYPILRLLSFGIC